MTNRMIAGVVRGVGGVGREIGWHVVLRLRIGGRGDVGVASSRATIVSTASGARIPHKESTRCRGERVVI